MSEVERHIPEHPLPEEIQKMTRDDTVCKFCGVSYLIHNEIKALEDKLKATEKELQHFKGCESRELAAKAELMKVQSQLEGLQQTMVVKENELTSCKKALQTKEEEFSSMLRKTQKLEDLMSDAVKMKEQLRLKLQTLHKHLPVLQRTIRQQSSEVRDVKSLVQKNKELMVAECRQLGNTLMQHSDASKKDVEMTKATLKDLEQRNNEFQAKMSAMNEEIAVKDKEMAKLSSSDAQVKELRNTVRGLRDELAGVQSQLDTASSSNKSFGIQVEQYKEQLRSKSREVENLTQQLKVRDQISEQNISKLQFELKQKNAEIDMLEKDSQHMKGKFLEQQRIDDEMKRRASMSNVESRETREALKKAQEDLAALKAERELMITSHQNRIEQLRESFKNKMYEAEKWPEKLEEALSKERQKHVTEMKVLEEKLKENFVMELQIEKQKHQELLNKYKNEARETEAKLREQITGSSGRLKGEIEDLKQQLREARVKAQETEEVLREEIQSLKAIIRDLEDRLGRLDVGNEEKVVSLKGELKAKSLELAESHTENRKLEEQINSLKEEIVFLQETVRRECEERYELTEALSEAKEQLLALRRPSGGYSPGPQKGGQLSDSLSSRSGKSSRSEEMMIFKKKAANLSSGAPIPHPPSSPLSSKEVAQSINMMYEGDTRDVSPGRLKGGSLADGRKRIANALGKR